MDNEILTLDEAAAYLKVAPETVTQLLDEGALRGKKLAGEWRTTRRAAQSLVDGMAEMMSCCCGPDGTCCTPAAAAESGGGCCC